MPGPRITLPPTRLGPLAVVPAIPIVRPQDLVVLELRLFNLKVDQSGATLIRAGPGDAFLSLGFPPQHVAEQAFFEADPRFKYAAAKGESVTPPPDETASLHVPVQALLSGSSRLVFEVPVGAPPIPYTLEGILAACSTFEPSVAANALPPQRKVSLRPAVAKPHAASAVGPFLTKTRSAARARSHRRASTATATAVDQLVVQSHQAIDAIAHAARPRPARPTATETAIEAPYRMILSPSRVGRWAHAPTPVKPAASDRTDLWNTRLGVHGSQGVDESDDFYRAVRAIWTRDPDFDPTLEQPLPPHFPDPGSDSPFRTSLDGFDRHNIVHLSSNFALSAKGKPYVPRALEVERLALSALGSWLDLRGVWPEPVPDKLAVEEWRQRGTLGRDHYVRVVYAGKLFPVKHAASVIKITERIFHRDRPGSPAFLRQRMKVVPRRRLESYTDPKLPYRSFELTTVSTPWLDDPGADPSKIVLPGESFAAQSCFWPHAGGSAFEFQFVGLDADGRPSDFTIPLIFVGREVLTTGTPGEINARLEKIKKEYDSRTAGGKHLAEALLAGQPVAYADSARPDDTTLETESITFTAAISGKEFSPRLERARVLVPALKHLAGVTQALEVQYPEAFTGPAPEDGNKGELFLQTPEPAPDTAPDVELSFANQGDRSGGFVQPNMKLRGLSRRLGPVAGAPAKVADGTFDAGEFFGALDTAKLFGVISLADIVGDVIGALDTPAGLDQSPAFRGETLDVVSAFLLGLERLAADLASGGVAAPPAMSAVVANPEVLPAQLGPLGTALANLSLPSNGTEDLTSGLRARIDARLAELRAAVQAPDFASAVAKHAALQELPLATHASFEWRPRIAPFPASDPIFVPAERGLTVAARVRTQDTTGGRPRLDVTCLLENFDLHLIAPATFITIKVEKLELLLRDGKKPDVDLVLKKDDGVAFDGPLRFVNTLKDYIPLDGFSDPPALAVTDDGIEASYSLGLPTVAVGVFSLQNLSLGAGFRIPFVGADPLDVSFNFSTRENPALLTVTLFGGGAFFGITINPQGVHILEAAFEFGAALSIDLGVASGGVSAMAGIYFKIESDEAALTGYFRLRGEVEVLGIVSVSLELYMELSYEFSSGKCVGRATISVCVEIAFVEETVEISCERRFAGSSGDPTFEEAVPPDAWGEYCEAFA